MIQTQRVTRELLEAIAAGDERSFKLPGPEAVQSGKSYAYQLQPFLGCKFRCSTNYVDNVLTIKREET